MNWAWAQKTGGPTEKVVLLKVADNTDDFCRAYPSIPLIARQCEISVRTAQRTLRQLERAGLLTIEPRFLGVHQQTSNLYTLACPPPGKEINGRRGDKSTPLTAVTPTSPPIVSPTGVTCATRTVFEPSNRIQPQLQGGGESTFIFPTSFDATTRTAVVSRLAILDPIVAQQVLDELAGRMQLAKVRNPLRYLSTLIDRVQAGTFTPDLAEPLQAGRRARERSLASTEAAVRRASSEAMTVDAETMPSYLRDFLAQRAKSSEGKKALANDNS